MTSSTTNKGKPSSLGATRRIGSREANCISSPGGQADSLPQKLLAELRADRAAWDRQHGNTPVYVLRGPAREEYYRLFHHRVQTWLDAGHGSCLLRRLEPRRIIINAFHCFNG